MDYSDLFQVDATLVANEFLDNYMPKANGEYVKVYLYLLRNRVGGIDVSTIAENLELTEGDVRRALRYWEEQGILTRGAKASAGTDRAEQRSAEEGRGAEAAGRKGRQTGIADRTENSSERTSAAAPQDLPEAALEKVRAKQETAAGETQAAGSAQSAGVMMQASEHGTDRELLDQEELRRSYKRASGTAKINALMQDAEFAQLLFVVQKYMSKILSERDVQVFAYLYDGLKMPCDVLEYLVEYCVQTGHTSMRYIETVGLDWATAGIRDTAAARQRAKQFEQSREESGKRRSVRRNKLGVTRDTDYNTVFSDRSSLILEQVIRKQMEQ